MATGGVVIDDTLASGGTVDLAGWEASTQAGHGIYVESWPNGDVEVRGDKVYNNCGSGVYVSDTTTHVSIAASTTINNNGTTFGGNAGCVAWQAANPGHGYGSGVRTDFEHLVARLALRECRRHKLRHV